MSLAISVSKRAFAPPPPPAPRQTPGEPFGGGPHWTPILPFALFAAILLLLRIFR